MNNESHEQPPKVVGFALPSPEAPEGALAAQSRKPQEVVVAKAVTSAATVTVTETASDTATATETVTETVSAVYPNAFPTKSRILLITYGHNAELLQLRDPLYLGFLNRTQNPNQIQILIQNSEFRSSEV